MKYTWESPDIVKGLRVKHFTGRTLYIAEASSRDKAFAGFVLVDLVDYHVGPVYSAEQLAEIFNSQKVEPMFL